MADPFTIPAIGEIADPDQIRVVLFINNKLVHAPLTELVKHLLTRIEDLETRVTDLETP
ncbi:hypothetical protein [Rhizobium leguminosarum]|uniref:hypothetical protein n=1 Tax=Rhizobium leguminosarum TaxID=384 RepID=UPI0013EEEAAC|nr:hypothetical protein [Rhizobium leguminosarum]